MATKTYSLKDITLIVGSTIVDNFTNISVTMDNDKVTFTEGCNGEVTRTKSGSKLGTIEITLPQTNDANDMFSLYCNTNGLVPVEIKDNNGKSLHSMLQGAIVKMADAGYAIESGDRVWSIKGAIDVNHIGGNF